MSIIKGLKNIEAILDKPKSDMSSGQKVTWLKLDDGQSASIRFLSELDADSPNYDEKRGLAIVVSEHTNPEDYKRKAVCSAESQGRCFGCEMYRKEPKSGWRPRLRFYCNVVFDNGIDDKHVAVWSMGVSKTATFNTLREYVADAGSISNMVWKLKRNGKGTETNYVLLPTKTDTEPFNWSGFEPFNLEKVVKDVPYSEQESFYFGFSNAATSTSVDW
ncbi:MAG: hypothetical protein ACO295_00410 [Sediminibacterium sp.]